MMATKAAGAHLSGDPTVVKWGYLYKKGGERRNWTHRFFILKETADKTYCVEYHKDHKVLYIIYSLSCLFSYCYF